MSHSINHDHIAAGPQHWHIWDSNPHTVDCLRLDVKLANRYTAEDVQTQYDIFSFWFTCFQTGMIYMNGFYTFISPLTFVFHKN